MAGTQPSLGRPVDADPQRILVREGSARNPPPTGNARCCDASDRGGLEHFSPIGQNLPALATSTRTEPRCCARLWRGTVVALDERHEVENLMQWR